MTSPEHIRDPYLDAQLTAEIDDDFGTANDLDRPPPYVARQEAKGLFGLRVYATSGRRQTRPTPVITARPKEAIRDYARILKQEAPGEDWTQWTVKAIRHDNAFHVLDKAPAIETPADAGSDTWKMSLLGVAPDGTVLHEKEAEGHPRREALAFAHDLRQTGRWNQDWTQWRVDARHRQTRELLARCPVAETT